MFCVECGKETAIFKEGVCLNCYLKSHVFTNGPNELDLPICQYCNSLKYKNTWSSDLLDDLLQKWIKNNFNISKELKKVKITTECKETKQGIKCKVIISGFIDKEEITEKHCLLIHLKKNVCDVCSKKFGGYHEAIIQVRAGKRKLVSNEIDEMINKIQNLVENLHEKGNRSLFITDIGEEHGNLDFFISDK